MADQEPMTEEEWLGPGDPGVLLDHVPEAIKSRRKCRLLACAFCGRVWDQMTVPIAREAVELAEAHADGLVGAAELDTASEAVYQFCLAARDGRPDWRTETDPHLLACRAAWYASWSDPAGQHGNSEGTGYVALVVPQVVYHAKAGVMSEDEALAARYAEDDALCGLVRDNFGNPFRPVKFDPAWRSDTAVSLAKGIYESRDFAAMPILADALQDTGCEDADILTHCRDTNQVHVRGCWVVDLVLGKS